MDAVLGLSRGKEAVGYIDLGQIQTYRLVQIDMKRRFITGIGLCNHEDPGVPQSVICKLETQADWWYDSVQ